MKEGANMKKAALGFIALAMALIANTAQALGGSGDVRSINPCDEYGNVIPQGSIQQPYVAGQTAYFRLRLENANSTESWDSRKGSRLRNHWQFAWDSSMYPGYSLMDMLAMYPPAIGVNVSGQSRAARISLIEPADAGWYTDLVCSYRVEPGDFALPMTLVSDNGEYMLGVAAGNAINRSSLWSLVSYTRDCPADLSAWGAITGTNVCSLVWDNGDGLWRHNSANEECQSWKADLTLSQAGLYIKTIDFASSEYSVAEGRTDKVTVDIVGGVNTNGNGVVYAKIKDGSHVSLAEDPVEIIEMWDGEGTNAYQVAKIVIPSGEDVSSFSFKVRGNVQTNDPAIVYLSSTKEFAYEDGFGVNGQDIVTNFVTAAVYCVAPPPPYISVTLDGAARKTVTAGSNYTDYAAVLTVALSEAYTSDVEVEVKPTVNGASFDVGKKYIGLSTFSDNGYLGTNTTVRFTVDEMEAGVLSKNLYVYVLGGDDNTAAIDKGVLFTPAAKGASADYFRNENQVATLYVNKSTPVIRSPAEGDVHPEINGGVEYKFRVSISDDYMNMADTYTVEWWIDGAGTPVTVSNLSVAGGEITVPVTYIAEGSHTTAFRIKNSSGTYSEDRHFTVPVRKPKTVKAEVLTAADSSGRYTEDVGELEIRFLLSEAYSTSTQPIYAYLIPMNAAASNQVACTGLAFTEGVAILPGQTTSFMNAAIKVLDGTNGSLLRFKVLLSSSEQNTGNLATIGEYASQDLYIPIVNKAPAVSSVSMSGSLPVTVNGQTFRGKASIGLNKVFGLTADDVDIDLTNNVTVTWNFSDPNGYLFTTNMTGLLSEIVLTNQFEVAGTYDCNVKIKDKDMTDSEFARLAPFEFKLIVSEKPTVLIKFPNSNTFNETDADKGMSYFDVELSTPASRPIDIGIECTRVAGASGVLNVTTNMLHFRAGQMSQRVLIDELDGTIDSVSFKGGFIVKASVVTTTLNEDGVPWSSVYDSVTEKMYVANEAPTIVFPVDTGATNDAAINVQIPLSWKIADVDFDLTNKLTVVWTTSEGVREEFKGSDVVDGVFTNVFKSGGAKTVTMTVTDKDGGVSSVTLYYKVAASKQVYVYPMGPYYGGLTPLSKVYASAAGIGEGRAWADGTRATENFVHTYTYGATMGTAKISASGYVDGQEDGDIDAAGNAYDEGDVAYVYRDLTGRDSFFYAWLVAAKEEEATTYTGNVLISPVSPKSKVGTVQYPLSLPTELAGDDTNPMYPDRFIEAFFSKELYPSDNMGDMNADGVPDYFATLPWSMPTGESMTVPEAMTGQAISGSNGGEDGEGESATASDLANISTYNGDLDFLPVAWSSSNPLNPAVRNWGPGQPFTTVREIRGLGNGLNEPGISDYDLTDAETSALFAACALAGAPAADYAAATNWAKSTGWTPESLNPRSATRLNPVNPDTDGDGFDDGWEYYFWYYAKVGAIVDGVWSRLEGRRFDAASSTLSVRISADEIVEAFNPHVTRVTESAFGMDFDNDGLSDLEEYALGTNPCDWDSDGDGAGDLWEVMMGLDPCSADSYLNPDCDFMARCEYAEDTFTVYTLADGKIFALPTSSASSITPAESASTSNYFKVEVAVGVDTAAYWVTNSPVVYIVGGNSCLASSVDAYASLEIGGKVYLGEAVVLASGTPVAIAATAEPVLQAVIPESGFDWIKPTTNEKGATTTALELFNYGGDGVTYVPCTSNATTYAEIPVGSVVARVQSDVKVTLLHNQVMVQYGFDPRVAWNINEYGFLDDRWRRQNSEDAGSMGFAGVPTNTVAYASRDEFLVAQYRMNAQRADFPGLENASPSVAFYMANTTFPNLPLEFIRELEYSYSPFTETNETYLAYWDSLTKNATVHGADTDCDGIPDGWELYVKADPNLRLDASLHNLDVDNLSLVEEYAGVDSCNAYTNRFDMQGNLVYPEVETITKNHPGKKDGWWNKFFPTNPYATDTDGDGIVDHLERDSSSGSFPVGRNVYGAKFTFIYGDNAEKYAADGSTVCFRGGGLNPCSVDTDCDLLPDPWEYEFAGIVVDGGTPSVALDPADLLTLIQADEHQSGIDTNAVAQIRGGMDGTYNGDANLDFDHDGLLNFQEYLVQSLRHLRYDDSLTPLMGVHPGARKFVRFIPFSAWDGNAFQEKCKEKGFTGLGAWQFGKLGYFTLAPHSWDPLAQNTAGLSGCANYAHSEGAGYRVMLRPSVDIPTMLGTQTIQASGYASTDPRRWDTDNDGMDDYYEIFHGLNPILGSASDPMSINEQGLHNFRTYDVIGAIYGGTVNAWCNHWTDWNLDEQPAFDAIRHPWLIGTMECDADGDGLRNDEEALKVNLAKPQNTHTDPTPLWMTDSTSAKFASFTSQYYGPDPYLSEVPMYTEGITHHDLFNYPWKDLRWNTVVYAPGSGGINRNWMFSFEENEGYDTDHDFRSDSTELVKGVEPTSDPLNFMDPNRRQALYLPGDQSAAVSYDSESRRSIGTEPDLLKQFTVECWVRPEGAQRNVVILERVCVYGASTLSNNQTYVRANFRIGVDSDGKVYGEYEGSTADSGAIRVTGLALGSGVWTHLAFTYDGYTAALYMNGAVAPVASANGVGLLPANGIDGILQESGTSVMPYTGYRALPCANIIGARALNKNAVSVNPETTWADFSGFYKGWIDEVRVWDGARSASDLHSNYLKRYSFDDVNSLRETVYKAWRNGATRADSNPRTALPPELLLHYSFATLPGAVDAANVIAEPTGFQAAVLDNVRKPNIKDLDEALYVGWWSKLSAINSKVYSNYAIVPWIPNTVAHLPVMDGSSIDSQYWSSYAAGVIGNQNGYAYPNSANPYPTYVYRFEKLHHLNRLAVAPSLQLYDTMGYPIYDRYAFQLRSDFVGATDLVPLGGAFAKRGADFWDGQGAMDAWTATSVNGAVADSDADGIPDWAEALGYTTAEAYLRALAEGLLPDATAKEDFDATYADKADSNNDGLRDWWQRLHDLKGAAKSDTDKDGLADFAEYLVSDVFKFGEISPVLSKTNGKEFDYFRKAGRLYLGELFTDHDFMEDEWENLFANGVVDAVQYDPSADADADGWSNYAECRAGTLPDRFATITAEGQQVPEYPEPLISVKAFYKNASLVSAPIVVKAYSSNASVEDAKWNVPGSDTAMDYDRIVGVNPGVKTKYLLGPSVVVPGTVTVYFRDPSELNVTDGRGVWGSPSSSVWREVLEETPIQGVNDAANLSAVTENIGTLIYRTGEMEIDFSALSSYRYELEDETYMFYHPQTNTYIRSNLDQSYVKIHWQSKRLVDESKWEFALSRASTGHVREGLNTFVAFVDIDGNGEYTEGEPMGIARNVNVGWNSANVEIQLADGGPATPRYALGLDSGAESIARSTRIDMKRVQINSLVGNSYGKVEDTNPYILGRDIANRVYLHEGDFMNATDFDIDWSAFKADVLNSKMVVNGKMNVTTVTYRVTLESNVALASNTFEVVRTFTASQLKPVPVNANVINYGARPLFTWRLDDDGADTFTAFSIVVKDGSGATVWNSGYQAMPPKLPSGVYEWRAPLYVNDLASAGKVFKNLENYTWQVSVHNSKYQDPLWSDAQTFRMNVYDSSEANSGNYGVIKASVKYYGPGQYNVAQIKMEDIIRVEAYTTPDFSGVPAGRTYVPSGCYDSVTNDSHAVNATIVGLEAGTYYLRAFIDSDGDCKRSDWESWGYVCPRGDIVSGGVFSPTAIEVGYGAAPVEVCYIEDADVDQDCLPDVYEYNTADTDKTDFLEKKGVAENANNGYISVNPKLQTAIDNLVGAGNSVGLLSLGGGKVSMQVAALALGVPTLENTVKDSTLAVTGLTLENGAVNLTVGAEADEPSLGTVFVSNGKVMTTVVVYYTAQLGGDWEVVVTKSVEFAIDDEGSVGDTFKIPLDGLDTTKGFFKVDLK